MSLMKKLGSRLPRRWVVLATTACVVGLAIVGCGETAPAPLTKDEFVVAKEEREKIIQKEYGQSAYKKAVDTGKAGNK